ncbi:MAG: hypothetical protein ABWZ66_06275 [Pyrinomonadaceae bacterium]
MKNKIIKAGLLFVLCFSLAGIYNAGTVRADSFENAAESSYSQAGKGCKVTKAGGSSMYVESLNKDFPLKRGAYLIVVDPEPHQGIIVVKAKINKKLTQGEIKLDDTNCVPILPR